MRKKIARFRNTNQKQLIFEMLRTSLSCPTAQQIYKSVRKKLPQISFGTVYRNLGSLESEGKIKSLHYSKDHVRYETEAGNHYHFVCKKCDKVECVDMEELVDIESQIAKRHGFKVANHALFFYGLCRDCCKLR